MLVQVNVKFNSNVLEPIDKCIEAFRRVVDVELIGNDEDLLPTHVCVTSGKSSGTCSGDGGGPMVSTKIKAVVS